MLKAVPFVLVAIALIVATVTGDPPPKECVGELKVKCPKEVSPKGIGVAGDLNLKGVNDKMSVSASLSPECRFETCYVLVAVSWISGTGPMQNQVLKIIGGTGEPKDKDVLLPFGSLVGTAGNAVVGTDVTITSTLYCDDVVVLNKDGTPQTETCIRKVVAPK